MQKRDIKAGALYRRTYTFETPWSGAICPVLQCVVAPKRGATEKWRWIDVGRLIKEDGSIDMNRAALEDPVVLSEEASPSHGSLSPIPDGEFQKIILVHATRRVEPYLGLIAIFRFQRQYFGQADISSGWENRAGKESTVSLKVQYRSPREEVLELDEHLRSYGELRTLQRLSEEMEVGLSDLLFAHAHFNYKVHGGCLVGVTEEEGSFFPEIVKEFPQVVLPATKEGTPVAFANSACHAAPPSDRSFLVLGKTENEVKWNTLWVEACQEAYTLERVLFAMRSGIPVSADPEPLAQALERLAEMSREWTPEKVQKVLHVDSALTHWEALGLAPHGTMNDLAEEWR